MPGIHPLKINPPFNPSPGYYLPSSFSEIKRTATHHNEPGLYPIVSLPPTWDQRPDPPRFSRTGSVLLSLLGINPHDLVRRTQQQVCRPDVYYRAHGRLFLHVLVILFLGGRFLLSGNVRVQQHCPVIREHVLWNLPWPVLAI